MAPRFYTCTRSHPFSLTKPTPYSPHFCICMGTWSNLHLSAHFSNEQSFPLSSIVSEITSIQIFSSNLHYLSHSADNYAPSFSNRSNGRTFHSLTTFIYFFNVLCFLSFIHKLVFFCRSIYNSLQVPLKKFWSLLKNKDVAVHICGPSASND